MPQNGWENRPANAPMSNEMKRERLFFEVMLIIVTVGLTWLIFRMGAHKVVVLNLFFLPVVLSGYYLGRTAAGVLAVLCAALVSVATMLSPSGFSAYDTLLGVGLVITVWAAILGLTALLVGTLCDERARTVSELHTAYLGVVEVLSKYLQSANPRAKARSTGVAELSQLVAQELRLSRQQVDDVRVAALLHDIGNVEITTKVITRAVDTLESAPDDASGRTFLGMELVRSLEPVLSGAMPLLMCQDDRLQDCLATDQDPLVIDIPIGAKIIRTSRAYYDVAERANGDASAALAELRREPPDRHAPEVLRALERVLKRTAAKDTATSKHAPATGQPACRAT